MRPILQRSKAMSSKRSTLRLSLRAVACGLALAMAAGAGPGVARPTAKPNIIVIVADDLGYGDLSSYGSPHQTPHIDRLASDGVRFTEGYATAALCSPSRAALMTGRYQQRFGYEYQLSDNVRDGIDVAQPMLSRALRAAGYRTALFGKWHLGMAPERQPLQMGFDEFFGILGGQARYTAESRPDVVSSPEPALQPRFYADTPASQYRENGRPVDLPDYSTTAFTEHALRFIDENKARPFFLMLTYTAPHVPLQATEAQLAKAADIQDPQMRLYRAVINELDAGVGQIRERLVRNGLAENTMIVFVSDNGCPDYVGGVCANTPLNGWKRYLTEWEQIAPIRRRPAQRAIRTGRRMGAICSHSFKALTKASPTSGSTGARFRPTRSAAATGSCWSTPAPRARRSPCSSISLTTDQRRRTCRDNIRRSSRGLTRNGKPGAMASPRRAGRRRGSSTWTSMACPCEPPTDGVPDIEGAPLSTRRRQP